MYKIGHACTYYLLLEESVANDVINVSVFAHAVHFVHGHGRLSPGARSMDSVVCSRFINSLSLIHI